MTTAPQKINFGRVAESALLYADVLVPRWAPSGTRVGVEWVAINPTRADGRRGSFKVNLATGAWADFATNDRGGDLVSLASYLFRLRQSEAALKIADMLGIDAHE